jgi:choice-of-anchor B domain-containing protein
MSKANRGRRPVAIAAAALTAAALATRAHAFDRTFNVSLVGSFNPLTTGPGTTNNFYSDLWADGNLVVIGSVATTGVCIIDNTNPAAPTLLSRYNPALPVGGQFRDILIRGNWGYFAIDDPSSNPGGIHIVDLSNPAAPVKVADINGSVNNGFARNHDLFIDGNYMYVATNQVTTCKVYDISTPSAPMFVRDIVTAGAPSDDLHDMTVKNGRMYTSNLSNGMTQIWDVTNVAAQAPTLLGTFTSGTRTHSDWPSEDGTILAVAREDLNADVKLWDISNPASPVLKSTINKTTLAIDSHSPHNPVIIGDTMYVSWYQAGLQIINIRDPANPVHLGAYDSFVGGDGNTGSFSGYDGNWGVYPFFGYNKILLSDFDNGLLTVDASAAFKQIWTWGADDSGKWQENTRWDSGAGPIPNNSEMIASFTSAAAGTARTVTVDGTLAPSNPRVASLEFSSALSYTLAGGGGGEIQLKNSTGNATITVLLGVNSNGVNRVTCPIDLQSDLTVTNSASAVPAAPTLELGAVRGTGRTITFAGTGKTALTAASPSFSGSIVVNSGTLSLRDGGASNAQPITLAGGTLALQNNASINFSSDLSVTDNAALIIGNISSGSGQVHTIGDVTVTSGKILTMTRQNGAHLAAADLTAGGTFKVASGAFAASARFNSVDIPPGGKLDVSDGAVIIASGGVGTWDGVSSYTGVTGMVQRGRNGGDWSGSGIVTSAAGSTTSLGVASATDAGRAGGTFGGISVSAGDTLVMYTYAGDANLDGKINVDDYGRIDTNIGLGTAGWYNGDFNYDGKVDVDDYGIIDTIIGIQGAPFSTALAATPRVARPVRANAVPEPAAGAVLLLAATLLPARHRRGRR